MVKIKITTNHTSTIANRIQMMEGVSSNGRAGALGGGDCMFKKQGGKVTIFNLCFNLIRKLKYTCAAIIK